MDSIIFDIDGTLWDSRIPVAHSWNCSIEKYTGKPSTFTPEFLGTYFGRTMDVIIALLLPDASAEEREIYGAKIFQEESQWLKKEPGTVYPGVAETLASLSAQVPLYVVSNCLRDYLEVMLSVTGLEQYFSGNLCYGDTGTSKGQTLLQLCRRHGLNDPIYVGDTQGDADACTEAGIPMIYAAYGLGQVEHPWKTIHSFQELTQLIGGCPPENKPGEPLPNQNIF